MAKRVGSTRGLCRWRAISRPLLLASVGIVTILLGSACSAFGIRSSTEQPSYTVVETLASNVEVRRYDPRLAAEVVVGGEEAVARSAGFRKLAAFIFGENRTRQPIAMIAPVSQAASEQIAMTAPVSQEEVGRRQWRVRFFMPSQYRLETLPEPNDQDITILELPPETLAVIRFSGSRAPLAVHEATEELLGVIPSTEWHVSGEPRALFYDPPWTLWFLRRNEVAVNVETKGTVSSSPMSRKHGNVTRGQ